MTRKALLLVALFCLSFLLAGCWIFQEGLAGITTATIHGRVTLASNGQIVVGAVVTATRDGTLVRQATTDSDGRYSISSLRAGTYTVQASYDGHTSPPITVTVDPGGKFSCNLVIDDQSEET